ncbi:uncharacterized protein LOC117566177 [Drosophila albomicans]|uniref:Uncharacterized protein LOC117566177 n=1 Tax=Drosophila albomicans TaxID=7291 RepID=A0A6P8WD56_DROAB|nr:uncharacterized protein LOC117566177 [Drosophila albomicans]
MCICSACKWIDNICCPLAKKAQFFAFWTLIHGLVMTTLSLIYQFWEEKEWKYAAFAVAIPHLVAGLLMVYSIYKSLPTLYLVSVIGSSFGPFALFLVAYLPIMQIFEIIVACRFYSTVLK